MSDYEKQKGGRYNAQGYPTANLKKKENNFKSPREFIVKATTLSKARENAGDLVMTGFVSADFLRRWREFF